MRPIDADDLEKSLENSCDSEIATHYFVEFLNYVDEQPTLDSIIFPQTIGNITYYSAKDLIEWVENQQKISRPYDHIWDMYLDEFEDA